MLVVVEVITWCPSGSLSWLLICRCMWFFFFFQAEDGIRDLTVTGVQTCALPIFQGNRGRLASQFGEVPAGGVARDLEKPGAKQSTIPDLRGFAVNREHNILCQEIGRASCRERV